jgi:hypothetical protein
MKRRVFLALLFVAGLVLCNSLFNAYKIDLVAFERNARQLLEKTGHILENASSFDGKKALQDLGTNRMNGFYYRFDDRIEEATPGHGKKETCNTAYETLAREMRPCIRMTTPCTLRYPVALPGKKELFLRSGLGIAHGHDPVIFTVSVADGTQEHVLLSREIRDPDTWNDIKLDLSAWSEKQVAITLKAASAGGNVAFWSNPILYAPPGERFNVIVILEDSLRADHMSCYGYPRKTTPVKDELAEEGVLFLNTFSQATGTRSSCSSLVTSLYPAATGVRDTPEILDDAYLTLPEIMRSQGFATASFVGYEEAGAMSGLHQGYEQTIDLWSPTRKYARKMYRTYVPRWLDTKSDRNFFIYVHIIDPRGPYSPAKHFRRMYERIAPGTTPVERDGAYDAPWVETPTLEGRRALYDSEIRFNDRQFSKLLGYLRARGFLRNTLLIIISDHGEHLGEHGLWGHAPPGYRQVLQVPLIMVYPKALPKNRRIVQPVGLIDIMPTVLDLAGIEKRGLLMQGDSLLPLVKAERLDLWDNRVCVSDERSIFFRNWHILRSGGPFEVYNYFKDREEKHPARGFFADPLFRHRALRFLLALHSKNRLIRNVIIEKARVNAR